MRPWSILIARYGAGLRDRCVHCRCSRRSTSQLPFAGLIDPVLPARSGVKNVPVDSQRDKLRVAFGTVDASGSSAGFVVAALNNASATSREVVVLRVLLADILLCAFESF